MADADPALLAPTRRLCRRRPLSKESGEPNVTEDEAPDGCCSCCRCCACCAAIEPEAEEEEEEEEKRSSTMRNRLRPTEEEGTPSLLMASPATAPPVPA